MIDFIKITGAGSTDVNGVYKEDGLENGKPIYKNDKYEIKWNGSAWGIFVVGGSLITYLGNEDVATPNLVTTWVVNNATAPAPISETVSYDQFLTINSAGSEIVNKPFALTGIKNGKPSYTRNDTHEVQDGIVIEWNVDQWEINGVPSYEGGTYLEYYAAVESVDTPDLVTTWETAKDGTIPYPVFVVGLVKPFVSAVSRAVKRNRG